MGVGFSGSDVVELGIQIEKNGMDFYNGVASNSKSKKAVEVFKYLAGEEAKHIIAFEKLLKQVEIETPPETYAGEYYDYLKVLSEMHVFTKKNKGKEVAKQVKSDIQALDMAMGFERDSILLFYEMQKLVYKEDFAVIDSPIKQEQEHLTTLSGLRGKIS
jgi:rubrerythrin